VAASRPIAVQTAASISVASVASAGDIGVADEHSNLSDLGDTGNGTGER
jgi:hypothetical protein